MVTICPACGHQSAPDAHHCQHCGHGLLNGKPVPPPELEGRVFEKMTPEIEALLGPFDEQVYRDALREFEENGGVSGAEIIAEIGAMMKARD